MRLKTPNGKLVYRNVSKYLIDWDAEEKSKFQTEVKNFLHQYWRGALVYSEFPVFGSRLRIDIYNASINCAVEVNGEQHRSYVQYFAGSRIGYLNQIKRDMLKVKFCEINNIKLVEIYPDDMPLTKEWFLEKYDICL
jgi:hypothetical protein